MNKNNFTKDTCELMDKIKDVLKEHKVTTLTNYRLEDKYYLITDFMIITYSEKEKVMDIAFLVSTMPDVAAFFTLILTDFDEIKDINIMELYMRGENGKILTGNECIEQYQKNIKKSIIDDFIEEQVQLHYLRTNNVGSVC